MKYAFRIMTVSLADPTSRFKAYAVVSDDERLVIANILPISGAMSDFSGPLIDEILQKKSMGYAVLVEDRTERISANATKYLLEDIDGETGKPNLHEALDRYFWMVATESIVFHPDCQQYMIRPNVEGGRVEKLQDDKGRSYYRIDWRRFTGGHRAMLLCVVAACMEPVSDRYLDAMYGVADEPEPWRPWKSWRAITTEYDERRYREFAERENATFNELRLKKAID